MPNYMKFYDVNKYLFNNFNQTIFDMGLNTIDEEASDVIGVDVVNTEQIEKVLTPEQWRKIQETVTTILL